MGETRVDLLHLLEDLADAYPGDLEETVLTEIIANALDSGAATILLRTDSSASTITVIDDGKGMSRAELRRFHDVAATTKARGEGIGFAGVGIKLGLLLSEEVLTESRRAKTHIATSWRLTGRHRAPWHWTAAPGLVGERGTGVQLTLRDPLSPLMESGFLEMALLRHFEPLFDPVFDEVLRAHYPHGVPFQLNGRDLPRRPHSGAELVPIALHLARRRKPSASGYLARHNGDLAEEQRGLAVSTFGKVIKRGWDWLGASPAYPERVTGLIEAPALASCLTLNKVDFIRSGPKGAAYLAFRKSLQEVVSNQLAAWGDGRAADEQRQRRAARPVERDLEAVLLDLTERFPLLATLVDRRPGGRRKVRMAGNGVDPHGRPPDLFAPPPDGAIGAPDAQLSRQAPEAPEAPEHTVRAEDADVEPSPLSGRIESPARGGKRRAVRLGLTIHFETRPDEMELGRLVETTVWVNEAHPAYRRAAAARSEGYHLALSVAMALANVAVDSSQANAFVAEFLARWGSSMHQRETKPLSRKRRARD